MPEPANSPEDRRAHHIRRHQLPPRRPRHTACAVDGKIQRGARLRKGRSSTSMSFHSARHHDAAVAACTQLSNKKGETSAFTALLDQLHDTELLGAIITADALHTVAGHATYLLERGAHYLIYVKGNRLRLHTQGPTHAHGREERRSVKVTAVAGLAFPGARQVVRIERHRREHGKAQGSREVVFAVTDLDAHQVSPGELAAHARGHWTVENRVHYVRDVTFNEDSRRTRRGWPRWCWAV